MVAPGLTQEDRRFLAAYRDALAYDFGDVVERVIVFGSKARGEATVESDLDILVIVRSGDWRLKWNIADAAYGLAIGTSVVPSVKVYTHQEWEHLRQLGSEFYEAVVHDGVAAA